MMNKLCKPGLYKQTSSGYIYIKFTQFAQGLHSVCRSKKGFLWKTLGENLSWIIFVNLVQILSELCKLDVNKHIILC